MQNIRIFEYIRDTLWSLAIWRNESNVIKTKKIKKTSWGWAGPSSAQTGIGLHQHNEKEIYIDRSLVSFCSMRRPTWHFMPFKSDLRHLSYT